MILPKKIKFYGLRDISTMQLLKQNLSDEQIFEIKVVANVLPFRTNNYVVEELIDWNNIPDDPIFQLSFMQAGMLSKTQYNEMAEVIKANASKEEIRVVAKKIRNGLNPHPAGQMTANVPVMDNFIVRGIQHKYKETALVFPSAGQTCHSFCTFCFRWAQFIGDNDLKFSTDESNRFQEYLKSHTEVSDVLFTGGDPMVMSLQKLETYLLPLLQPEFEHIKNIRIGTKSLSFWPYRYVTDNDADGILNLFEKIMNAGKHLAFMAHVNHGRELETEVLRKAVRRLKNVGVKIRTQAPVVRHINDSADVWANMWRKQVNLGMIPYYMFVERETGAKEYFNIPLSRTFEIYKEAFQQISGLQRTARGPVMSATPGKVVIEGVTKINGEKVFVLSMLQARNPNWVKQPFFAKYDETSTWLEQLTPAFGEKKFFYEDELDEILEQKSVEHSSVVSSQ
ncbi:MAG: lysine 2,3-aminomutase [Melioribacteraceae bacterium]|nr:lysine 2,3-aminomutase [Melioribacteraceae bacterium]